MSKVTHAIVASIITVTIIAILLGDCRSNPAKKINDNIESMVKLQKQLEQKSFDISNLIREYQENINRFKDDIIRVKRSDGVSTFDQANNHQYIRNRLTLIQQRLAYQKFLRDYNQKIVGALIELDYLSEKGKADAKIQNVLGKDEMVEIITKLDDAIERYQPFAKELKVEIKTDELVSLENIWDSITPKVMRRD